MSTSASSLQAASDKNLLPRPFGRLTLLKLLARGGMGEVYLAVAGAIEGAERPCVVKLIRREHVHDSSFIARFLDETRVQAQLEHPGVVHVLEAAVAADGQPYVVVEYVEGRSIADLRTRAVQTGVRLQWADAIALCASIAEALTHVHERLDARGIPLQIVHRDVSPQNIMVGFAGETKLIDFGTARAANRKCHTVAGVVYAKPGYVAPEVANGVSGNFLVDLYALGVMVWELCSGRRFLQGDANEHLAAVAANRKPLPPIAAECAAPPELDGVIARLTSFATSARTPSARVAQSELVQLLTMSLPLPNGERGVRARISAVMTKLFPSEPNRSRAEFQKLVALAKRLRTEASTPTVTTRDEPGAATVRDERQLPGTCYRLERKIGAGAVGVVYEAHHKELGWRVALKVLSPEHAKKLESVARFRCEARAMSLLSHPGIVRLHDFGKASDGRMYLAMEYVEGETLEHRLTREGDMSVPDAIRLVENVAWIVSTVHAAGIVHRDIKPGNIVLTPNDGLKLLDFGVALVEGEAKDQDSLMGYNPLQMYGTPEYMAPEQLEGDKADARADIYALGTMLYELLVGRRPYAAASPVSLLEAKRTGDPDAPRRRAPARAISPHVERVVLRALARDPEDRYASMDEFAEALRSAALRPVTSVAVRVAKSVAVMSCVAAAGLWAYREMGSPRLADVSMASLSAHWSGGAASEASAKPDEVAASKAVANAPANAPAAMATVAAPLVAPVAAPAPTEGGSATPSAENNTPDAGASSAAPFETPPARTSASKRGAKATGGGAPSVRTRRVEIRPKNSHAATASGSDDKKPDSGAAARTHRQEQRSHDDDLDTGREEKAPPTSRRGGGTHRQLPR